MRINHEILRREMDAQRWTTTAMAEELESRKIDITRSHLSNIVNGHRNAAADIIQALAEVLNLNPYALLGPEDPKAAVRELVELYDLTADELFALGGERHPEAVA